MWQASRMPSPVAKRDCVGSLVELSALRDAAFGEDGASNATIFWTDADGYEPLRLERPQKPAHIS